MRAAAVAAFEIFRGPHGSVGLHDGDRLVENLRGRRVAAIERGRVDEGLERRARLTQRLRRPVELGLVEGKAPDHGENAPGIGVHRHHGAGNLGDLPQAVLSGAALHGLDIDDIAGRERAAHAAAGPAHAVDRQNAGLAFARHLAGFFARRLQTDARLRVAGVEHHREPPRLHVAERRNRRQLRSPVGRNVDVIHGAAKAMRLVEAHQAIRQRLARERLNFWIERGADGQTAFVKLFLAVTIEQFAPNLLGEIAGHVSVWREHARVDAKRLRLGLGSIRGRNESVGDQSVDHVISPLDGAITVQERVIVVRPFRQGGEIGRLGDGQLVDRFVEIIERGGADAVISEAQINLVEIEFENALLRIGRFDAKRNQRLANFAFDRAFVSDKEVFRHLLGDRRCALHMPAALGDHHQGAADALGVDAVMCIEILIFRRDESLLKHRRNRRTRQEQPSLVRIFGEDGAVAGVDAGCDRRLVVAQLRRIGQVLVVIKHHARDDDRADEEDNRPRREQKAQKSHEQPHQIHPRRGEGVRLAALVLDLVVSLSARAELSFADGSTHGP